MLKNNMASLALSDPDVQAFGDCFKVLNFPIPGVVPHPIKYFFRPAHG